MANRHNWTVVGLTAGLLLVGSGSAIATSGGVSSVAVASLQTSEDVGHGAKVSEAASAPGGPVVPDGCKNFGHWVSSEARGMTCGQNVRGGKDAHDSARP